MNLFTLKVRVKKLQRRNLKQEGVLQEDLQEGVLQEDLQEGAPQEGAPREGVLQDGDPREE